MANAKVAAERIIRDGQDAGEVVRHIPALFRKTSPEKVDLNVNEIIAEVLHLIQKETAEKRIAVETDLEKTLPPVRGDRVQLQQVIFNLLLNGIEAMDTVTDRPRKLLIRSKLQAADVILVEIRDHGTGLADSERVSSPALLRKEKEMGEMSPVPICRSIVEAHGGRLGTTPSPGSRNNLLFHLANGNERIRMKPDTPIIYVLDDDYRVREALSSLLLSMGHRVEVFASAADSLVFKKPSSPACLILDLDLPGMSGLELQREIAGPDTPPIIFLTGHADVPSSVRAMKAGAMEFLLKPFDHQELLKAIDAAILRDREARAKRAETAELQRRYALLTPRESVRSCRSSWPACSISKLPPNSAPARSRFRFIGDKSCARWERRRWQSW